jgi:hypothetical protein
MRAAVMPALSQDALLSVVAVRHAAETVVLRLVAEGQHVVALCAVVTFVPALRAEVTPVAAQPAA